MGCFPCFSPRRSDAAAAAASSRVDNDVPVAPRTPRTPRLSVDHPEHGKISRNNGARSFTFRELAIATRNFKDTNLIGEGGFGRVFKGHLESGQVVAIKQLDRNGLQGSKEFLVEVLMLTLLHHTNLVNLVGYCYEGDERLLVYEYMPMGSLEDHLFDLLPDKKPLDWNTRIKIALGAAKGLTYLHEDANPPVIYRDLKAANILLDEDFNPKLSDFGLAKLGPVGDRTHVSTRVMGTYGYCAPDYAMSGRLTLKSDIYSFGVLLLELISGRKAFDTSKLQSEQKLVSWSRSFLTDRRRYSLLADPLLQGCYPHRAFHQLVVITSMCLQEQPHVRPMISDVVIGLNYVASQPYIPETERKIRSSPPPSPSLQVARVRDGKKELLSSKSNR